MDAETLKLMGATAAVFGGFIGIVVFRFKRDRALTPLQRADAARELDGQRWGELNTLLICPHCQTRGDVRTRPVHQDKGISGAKAAGAVLTGGVSILATGLARNEKATQAHCCRCNSTWHYQ